MKKNLEIIESEHKITKAGKPFMRFKTSDGWISCFDEKEAKKLKAFEGGTACVEVVQSGDFQNISKCYGEASDEDKEEVEVVKMSPEKYRVNGTGAMYTSYAKDIFCAIFGCRFSAQPDRKSVLKEEWTMEDYMDESIDLVKQAQEAFE